MDNFESTNGANKEIWHVQLSSGEIRVMSLEQLDEAFHDGVVSENTFIYQAGMNDWIKLGALAGLDGDEESPAPENGDAVTIPMPPPPHPIVLDVTPTTHVLSAPPPAVAGAGALSLAPPPSFAAAALASNAAVGPNSMAPLASDKPDLEFDTDVAFRRKPSRGRWGLVIGAVACLGVVGVVAASRSSLSRSDAGAPAVPVAAAQAMMPLPSDTPAPEAAKLSSFEQTPTKMSDDTKKALLDADKVRAAKNRARQRAAPAASPRSRPLKSAQPFHKGGDSHDPLNSSL